MSTDSNPPSLSVCSFSSSSSSFPPGGRSHFLHLSVSVVRPRFIVSVSSAKARGEDQQATTTRSFFIWVFISVISFPFKSAAGQLGK